LQLSRRYKPLHLFRGPEDLLRARGVTVEVRDDPECVRLMAEFAAARPDLWSEDIGV
jgi:cytosine deaminase